MINEKGLKVIKKWESYHLKAYLCPAGKWTIGWGHTSDNLFKVEAGMTIDQNTADELLKYDIQEAARLVLKQIKVSLNENQFSALASIGYNSGSFITRSGNPTLLLKTINEGNLEKAAELIKTYKITAGGKILKGLKNRRLDEYELFISNT